MLDRKIPPTHPGIILGEALESMNLKIMPTAKLFGCTRQHLHKIVKGESPMSPAMAVKIGALCDNGPNLWANMQTAYDLWHEYRNQKEMIAKIAQHVAA